MSQDDGGQEPPNLLSTVREDLNHIERLASGFSPQDEYLEAMLQSQRILARNQMQAATLNGTLTTGEGVEGGRFSIPEEGALPEDAIGLVARDIYPNDTGPAVFQLNGTSFYAIVRNTDEEELQAGTSIRVTGGMNRVTSRGAAGGRGGGLGTSGNSDAFRYNGSLYEVPRVLTSGEDVKVGNQKYVRGERENVSGSLGPGQEKEIARIEPDANEFLLLKHTNATAHETVQYDYYIDTETEVDEDLSGSFPWATPPDLYEVVPEGFKLVEDFVSLQVTETSGENSYDAVQGTLTGLLITA